MLCFEGFDIGDNGCNGLLHSMVEFWGEIVYEMVRDCKDVLGW